MPARASGAASTIRANRVTVKKPAVIRWRSMARHSSSGSLSSRAVGTTTAPPLASAPHTSRVAASKDELATSRVRSCGPSGSVLLSRTSRTTAWCGMPTSLGTPLVPEVGIT